MYTVTFYSYKGGVGRTMALVNVAVLLAKLGRRVLVVDFDLEAPGLPSYQVFRGTECRRGIVDYVTSYRTTGVAPIASEYITQCEVDGNPLWLMPAGDHTRRGYSESLQSIDWQDLYEHQSGFLMFEDLKQQWAQYEGAGFDYVLIDSRTGHTDVGGICTRQLPDAVVVMFVPNEQNIDGLAPIVESIRAQNKKNSKPITLHFCPSNVPDLDDEKHILGDLLEEAKKKLGYEREPASIIHNYGSLEILTQTAFALSRPSSRLTKEFDTLRTSIIAANFSDREGALVALRQMPATFDWARKNQKPGKPEEIRANAIDIRRNHPRDGEIAFLAARVFGYIGEQDEELSALGTAIEVGSDVNRARLGRARLHLMAGRKDDAHSDLIEVLSSQAATVFELVPALQMALRVDSFWLTAVDKALDRPDSEYKTLATLSRFIMTQRDALPALARRMVQSIKSPMLSISQQQEARNMAVLSFIGSGDFVQAKRLLVETGAVPASLQDQFNLTMAEWGIAKKPSIEAFKLLAQRLATETPPGKLSANHHQCFALVLIVLGQAEAAEKELVAAKARISAGEMDFSCWRYLNVNGEAMVEDLNAMRAAVSQDKSIVPTFLENVPVTVH
ncbi:MAG: AAA family ATPase [Parvibaculum sp.]|uniref:tyrosine-protein kinase family protein n=1 Tax=Parvibaculum sp. TaxID=2024848 RepID=UPI0027163344|nr:AAA family ATPase [Parvibaculum sp.]MDO8838747.1 AAA family ATPase [Parvibaculum sp.]